MLFWLSTVLAFTIECPLAPKWTDQPIGRPIPIEDEDGILREGWVEVAPYWDPTSTVQVCAFEAQTERYSKSGTDCRRIEGRRDADCGCCPDLSWCYNN